MTSPGTSYGQVLTRFKRACEQGDVFRAELAARELPQVSLENALRLVCLYAAADDDKFEHAGVRFLGRLIAERRDTTIGSLQLAAGALMELRGHRRETAVSVLRGLL
jgi:hypothetical protein